MKIKQVVASGRFAGLKRLAFNKWSMTIAVMLLMLSVYMTMEQPGVGGDVLYVTDNLPYEVQKVSGDGDLEVLPNEREGDEGKQAAEVEADGEDDLNGDTDGEELDKMLDETGKFSINSDSDFFINYRLEREKARSRQLELLQGLIDDEGTSAEVKAKAEERVIAQAEAIEQELMLESILVARYGGEAAVFVQADKVNVVLNIDTDKMSDREAEKIAALVDNYTGIGYENVQVVIKE